MNNSKNGKGVVALKGRIAIKRLRTLNLELRYGKRNDRSRPEKRGINIVSGGGYKNARRSQVGGFAKCSSGSGGLK